jgi:gas vesicle protein
VILIVGLIILVAAVIVGVAGVLTNSGGAHTLTSGFSVFGYHVTGSTGALFLYGIVVGAVAVFGLSLLLATARRSSRRGRAARRGLKQSQRQTAAVSQDRDDLIDQRNTVQADTADGTGNSATPRAESIPQHRRLGRRHLFGLRSTPEPVGATTPVDR